MDVHVNVRASVRVSLQALVIAGATMLVVGCGRRDCSEVSTTETTSTTVASWQEITKSWPEDSKSAARAMTDKYGPPDEMTTSHLLWNQRGPWKRSILSRDPVHHEWPTPHEDVLEQVVAYRVPVDKVDELAAFDGSVMVERTKGELSARCGGEEANFLAVNLAHEIIQGRRSVDDARDTYASAMETRKTPQKSEYLKALRFTPTVQGAPDPDRSVK